MPHRLIRDSFLDSPGINRLSDAAECVFHRLMLLVDDTGRHDARADTLSQRLYPLDTRHTAPQILSLLEECQHAGLLTIYRWEEKPFLQIMRWQRNGNTQYAKHPWRDGTYRVTWIKRETPDGVKEFCHSSIPGTPPRNAAHRPPFPSDHRPRPVAQPRSSAILSGQPHEPDRERREACGLATDLPRFITSRLPASDSLSMDDFEPPEDLADSLEEPQLAACVEEPTLGQIPRETKPLSRRAQFERFWEAYPKKRLRDAAWQAWQTKRPPLEACLDAITRLCRTEEWRRENGRYIPHPGHWLDSGGWQDETELNPRLPLYPGEAPPPPLPDPEVWPAYVTQHPQYNGRHLRDLTSREQETFKVWAFNHQRHAWQQIKTEMREETQLGTEGEAARHPGKRSEETLHAPANYPATGLRPDVVH